MTHKSEDYKISAVKYYLKNKDNIRKTCKIFDCKKSTLQRWIQRYNSTKNLTRRNRTNVSSNGYFGLAMSSNASFAYLYVANTKLLAYNANTIALPVAQINTPSQGSVYFDQSANKLYVYNGLTSAWKSVTLA